MLETGLRRHAATAPLVDRARALAMLAEIATVAGEAERVAELLAEIEGFGLSDADRAAVEGDLDAIAAAGE
ncbi:hypothetical protein ACFV4K_12050 [Nocardia sp. NPDC059764]|uniref:hypothetical protein n=1 Tax=Nocardia sp. NPDC059764 TaxID=3346939 RepID=UPI0036547D8E